MMINQIQVDTKKVLFPVAEDLYGLFFEDINRAGDGGLYPEMIRKTSTDVQIKFHNSPSKGKIIFCIMKGIMRLSSIGKSREWGTGNRFTELRYCGIDCIAVIAGQIKKLCTGALMCQ